LCARKWYDEVMVSTAPKQELVANYEAQPYGGRFKQLLITCKYIICILPLVG
jgi:hypothetical protein